MPDVKSILMRLKGWDQCDFVTAFQFCPPKFQYKRRYERPELSSIVDITEAGAAERPWGIC